MRAVLRVALRVLAHRAVLGVGAVILAGSAIYARWQQDVYTAESECRSDIAGAFDTSVGESMFRIEDGLVAVSRGDDDALARVAERSDDARDRRDLALERRRESVAICSADPDFDPYEVAP